jgi:hypothetical protein
MSFKPKKQYVKTKEKFLVISIKFKIHHYNVIGAVFENLTYGKGDNGKIDLSIHIVRDNFKINRKIIEKEIREGVLYEGEKYLDRYHPDSNKENKIDMKKWEYAEELARKAMPDWFVWNNTQQFMMEG